MPVNIPNKQIVRILDNMLDGYEPVTELLPLGSCAGRVLAGDVAAGADVPGFDRSAVEGFALRAQDSANATVNAPAMLQLIERENVESIGKGQCAHVLPGSPIPKGADCVANVKASLMLGTDTGKVFIEKPQRTSSGIIFQKKDIRKGSIVLKKGTVLNGQHIALLAAMGISRAPVLGKPTVQVLAHGQLLVDVDEEADGQRLRDMVSPMLEAELGVINTLPRIMGIVDDEVLASALLDGDADIYIVSGDGLNRIIDDLPGSKEVGFLEIQGVSMGMFSLNGSLILLLPGHPAQAFFFYKLLCQPILQNMCGTQASFPTVQAILYSIPTISIGNSYLPVSIKTEGGKYLANPMDIVNCPIADLTRLHGYACIDGSTDSGDIVTVIIF